MHVKVAKTLPQTQDVPSGQAAPFRQRRPTGEPPAHRIGRVRPGGSKEPLVPQALLDISWHAVERIDVSLFLLPQMMSDELEQQRLRSRPWERPSTRASDQAGK
jgi:hypothetical protein